MDDILYESKKMFYKITVFKTHIEVKAWGSTQNIPIINIADMMQPIPFINSVRIQMNNGRHVAVAPKDPKKFMEVVMQQLHSKK